ncbi:unnamed protein product [Bursaphelenchus okinawaensis]|uniref:DM13 domain-containing protein n=1 Tax=Bursaphelenchus okinawaensis TaxID=465554 RepID=A0A811KIQ7_9BILA|nr:unnamed protein product [Bursaphelenchus okinawaensis]CAG9103679.1 unnamed protein product [Bursaphelenchus okinawaensis]
MTNADIISPNFVAPTSEALRKRTAIVPYSEYEKETEKQHHQLFSSTTAKNDDSVVLYLPPFERARGNDVAETDALSDRSSESKQTNPRGTNYSTSNRRNPLPYKKSIFRPKTIQVPKDTEPRFQANRAHKYQMPDEVIEKSPPQNQASKTELDQLQLFNNELVDLPVYKNVEPAPFPPLSSKPSNNIVESIFTQSQSNLRHAPPTSFVGLQPPISPVNPNVIPTPPVDALTPLAALLGGTGGGSPLETISKLARNLLASPNSKDLFSSMTKALGTSTAAEGSKLSSSAIGESSKLGVEETLFSSVKDEEKNGTESVIEDPEKLLKEAIANGELDPATFLPSKTVKPSAKIVDWIQQNRPKQSVLTAKDKLPYYGKYCGSFIENLKLSSYNVSGALWSIDEKRLLVSKFHFKPTSGSDNVTFWIGPAVPSNTEADMMPSDNGVYVTAEPVDIRSFVTIEVEEMEAKIRKDTTAITETAEAEEEDGTTKNTVRRMKRDGNTTFPLNFVAKTDGNNNVNLSFKMPLQDAPESQITMKPLDWYAGIQPMLITLPGQYTLKNINWISVYDHKAHDQGAMVLLPTDLQFQIPATVTLRPLTPNGPFQISSGKIRLLNTKTIEIQNFTLTTKGVPTWFMVGKDILPHKGGDILPVFNSTSLEFDCTSLRDYNNETVTLRLPGSLNMKDVFWFSVFSITKTTSYAHIYLPYNDLQLPPDLLGVVAPRCAYKT